jgi:hypothetical protein
MAKPEKVIYEQATYLMSMLTVTDKAEIIDQAIELGLLTSMGEKLMNSSDQVLVKRVLFGLSNVAGEQPHQAKAVLADELLAYQVLIKMDSPSHAIQSEAFWVLANALSTASPPSLKAFHDRWASEYMSRLLKQLDT